MKYIFGNVIFMVVANIIRPQYLSKNTIGGIASYLISDVGDMLLLYHDWVHIDGLVQYMYCSNSSVLSMELLQSCTRPSNYAWHCATFSNNLMCCLFQQALST